MTGLNNDDIAFCPFADASVRDGHFFYKSNSGVKSTGVNHGAKAQEVKKI